MHALAQISNELVRGFAVALAGAIRDDRLAWMMPSAMYVYWSPVHGDSRGSTRFLLAADVRPQLVAFHPVARGCRPSCDRAAPRTTTDASAKRADRLAVNASQPLDGADAAALGEGGDDCDLLVARKVVHGLDPWSCGSARSGTLEKQRGIRYICLSGHCFGARSRGFDPGPGCFQQHGPTGSAGSGRRIRTDISSLVRAGVLPLDEPRTLRSRLRGRFSLVLAQGKAASPFSSPPLLG